MWVERILEKLGLCQSGTELSIVSLVNVIFPDEYHYWIVSGTDFCADLLHNPLALS